MKITLSLSALLLASAPALAQDDSHSDWYDDFDVAMAVAKGNGKNMLVDFTGSDWCGWCIRLHDEVFQYDTFLDSVKKDYVLVALDFPQGEEAKAKVPNPDRNDELKRKYGVQGFPTILMMTNAGEVFAQTGYQEGGPEAYNQHMSDIAATGRKSLSAAKAIGVKYEAAKNLKEKINVVREAMAALKEADGAPGSSTLAAIARNGLELDANNAKGLKAEVIKALLGSGQADDALLETAGDMDPKNELGIYELVVLDQARSVDSLEAVKEAVAAIAKLDEMGGPKDREIAGELYTNGAFWCQRFVEDSAMAKKFAQKAILLADKDDAQVREALNEILSS